MTKQSVSVVCPQCRRPYVLKVDLEQVRRDRPRAVCSRCGERFDVYARLSEGSRPKKPPEEGGPGPSLQALAPLLGSGAEARADEPATPDPKVLAARQARREGEIRAAVTPPPPDREGKGRRRREARPSGQWTLELDLGRPFPWTREATVSLESLGHDYGPSASVVEWLLTDVSEDHGSATPPPVPIHARKTLPPEVIRPRDDDETPPRG